jgi:hypothetical protein
MLIKLTTVYVDPGRTTTLAAGSDCVAATVTLPCFTKFLTVQVGNWWEANGLPSWQLVEETVLLVAPSLRKLSIRYEGAAVAGVWQGAISAVSRLVAALVCIKLGCKGSSSNWCAAALSTMPCCCVSCLVIAGDWLRQAVQLQELGLYCQQLDVKDALGELTQVRHVH